MKRCRLHLTDYTIIDFASKEDRDRVIQVLRNCFTAMRVEDLD